MWCMIHHPKQLPGFKLWVIFKLLKFSRSTSGKIHCGGMIIIILKHPTLAIRVPSGLEVMDDETRLTTNVFQNMHMFRGTHNNLYWFVAPMITFVLTDTMPNFLLYPIPSLTLIGAIYLI